MDLQTLQMHRLIRYDVKYSVDEHNGVLYVEHEGLQDYLNEEIIETVKPIFESGNLKFEDITLLPLP